MAPILKDADSAVTTTTSAPASPAPKPPADASRTQPVALEIPVTINGAHTVAGSDKREPFSESTQTVLVFGHGAVVRVTASLAPGQLVFLTNEKTKKEVVCQVVKSKSGGSTNNNYVELQFTEPSPSFWGLRMSGAPPAPPAPRPVTSTAPLPAPAPPRPFAPAALPPPAKPVAVTPKPAGPTTPAPLISVPPPSPLSAPPQKPPVQAAVPPPPPKPAVAPLPPPSATITPTAVAAHPVVPVAPAPLISVPPPSPFATTPESPAVPVPPISQSFPAPKPPAGISPMVPAPPQNSPAPEKAPPAIPAPPPHDYAKEIEALFSVPTSTSRPAPAAPPEPKSAAPAASSAPASEQLKLEAARLQAQLGSMHFTETPAPTQAAPPATPQKAEPRATDAAIKIFEIPQEPLKPAPVPNTKLPVPKFATPPPPAHKPASSPSAADEEVRIPSWLAPLSQHSHSAAVETPASQPEVTESEVFEESAPAASSEPSAVHESPTFGGQLHSDSSATEPDTPPPSSRKALWIGVAAAVLFVVASVGFFFRPMLSGSAPSVSVKPPSLPMAAPSAASAVTAAVETKPSASPASTATSPVPASVASVPSPSQPARNLEPIPAPAASSSPSEVRPSSPATHSTPAVAAPEPPKRPALGDVHLAAPVVSRGANLQTDGEPLPSIDANSTPSSDGLAAVATSHRPQPTAPLAVGGDVQAAQLIKSVAPVYPQVAKTQHITGNVTIDCLIDANGNVADLKVLSGPPLLHRAATDAVKQWKYKPAILDGQPTAMHLSVTVQFKTQ